MALAFFEMGLFASAVQQIDKIVEVDRHFTKGQLLKAQILRAQGQELAALEIYQRTLRSGEFEMDMN